MHRISFNGTLAIFVLFVALFSDAAAAAAAASFVPKEYEFFPVTFFRLDIERLAFFLLLLLFSNVRSYIRLR